MKSVSTRRYTFPVQNSPAIDLAKCFREMRILTCWSSYWQMLHDAQVNKMTSLVPTQLWIVTASWCVRLLRPLSRFYQAPTVPSSVLLLRQHTNGPVLNWKLKHGRRKHLGRKRLQKSASMGRNLIDQVWYSTLGHEKYFCEANLEVFWLEWVCWVFDIGHRGSRLPFWAPRAQFSCCIYHLFLLRPQLLPAWWLKPPLHDWFR
jgi:hypothetical protein